MSAVEWNKKEDLLQEQVSRNLLKFLKLKSRFYFNLKALRHLQQYSKVFAAFSTNVRSELALINKIQVRRLLH